MKSIRFVTLSALMVIISAQVSLSQNTTFKLSDYKNPDYLYQTLDLNFGLNNYLYTSQNKTSYDYFQGNYTFQLNTGATFSSYANSPRSQTEKHFSLGAGMGSSGNYNKIDNGQIISNESNRNSFNHIEDLYISGVKRFYNEKQNYFEVNTSLRTGYVASSEKTKLYYNDTLMGYSDKYDREFNSSVAGALLIGKGRIEQVQDARLALYLLNDLNRLNRDKRPASDDDVLALARLITSLKYKRFFDTRLRKIAEITAIDSFLQGSKIAGVTDAAYFTSLNDNWLFANSPVRNSGRRIFTGIEAGFGYDYTRNNEDNKVTNQNISNQTQKRQDGNIFIVAGINRENPINLHWQQSANIKAGIGSVYTLESNRISPLVNGTDYDLFTGNFPAVKVEADYGYRYYPNSRTWLNANWSLSAYYTKETFGTSRNDKKNSQNNLSASTGPRVDAYYYLSEKLRFILSFNGTFRLTKGKNTYDGASLLSDYKSSSTSWNHYLSAAITYGLF